MTFYDDSYGKVKRIRRIFLREYTISSSNRIDDVGSILFVKLTLVRDKGKKENTRERTHARTQNEWMGETKRKDGEINRYIMGKLMGNH